MLDGVSQLPPEFLAVVDVVVGVEVVVLPFHEYPRLDSLVIGVAVVDTAVGIPHALPERHRPPRPVLGVVWELEELRVSALGVVDQEVAPQFPVDGPVGEERRSLELGENWWERNPGSVASPSAGLRRENLHLYNPTAMPTACSTTGTRFFHLRTAVYQHDLVVEAVEGQALGDDPAGDVWQRRERHTLLRVDDEEVEGGVVFFIAAVAEQNHAIAGSANVGGFVDEEATGLGRRAIVSDMKEDVLRRPIAEQIVAEKTLISLTSHLHDHPNLPPLQT